MSSIEKQIAKVKEDCKDSLHPIVATIQRSDGPITLIHGGISMREHFALEIYKSLTLNDKLLTWAELKERAIEEADALLIKLRETKDL